MTDFTIMDPIGTDTTKSGEDYDGELEKVLQNLRPSLASQARGQASDA